MNESLKEGGRSATTGAGRERYRKLLVLTGSASAREVTREAGFDIEGRAFWREGMRFVDERVQEFEALVAAGAAAK